MNFERRQFLQRAGATAAFTVSYTFASAQTFPSRPITIVVGFPAGSAMDTRARVLAERIKAALGQPVIVENVTGAGGSIGVGRVVRAASDGYTLSIGDMGNYVANQAIYPLQYDLRTDLQPIAKVSTGAYLIVSRNGMPAPSLKELVAWLGATPARQPLELAELAQRIILPESSSNKAPERGSGTSLIVAPYLPSKTCLPA